MIRVERHTWNSSGKCGAVTFFCCVANGDFTEESQQDRIGEEG